MPDESNNEFLKDRVFDNGGVQISIDTLTKYKGSSSLRSFINASLEEESAKKSKEAKIEELKSFISEQG